MAIEILTDRSKTASGLRDLTDIDPAWFEQIRVALGYGGPYKAAMRWQGEAWSQAVIYPAVRNPDPTGDPIPLENDRLEKLVAKFSAGHRQAAAWIMQAYGQLVIASQVTKREGVVDPAAGPGGGEYPLTGGYPLGVPGDDQAPDVDDQGDEIDPDDVEVYLSWTAFNLTEAPEVWQLAPNKDPGGGARINENDPGSRIGRWWSPDYVCDPDSPDSPTRDALNDLELGHLLMANIGATCKNRMYSRGVYKVPNDCTIVGPPGGGPEPRTAGSLADEFYLAAKQPVNNAGEAAAALPMLMEGPADSLSKTAYDSFSTPLDARLVDLVEMVLRNQAITADTPPDVMLGRSGTHWDAFLSAEQNVNINLSSGLQQALQAFYAIVVEPFVAAEYEAGRLPAGVTADDVLIGFSFRRLASKYGTSDPLRGFVGKSIDDISDATELQMLVLAQMASKGYSPADAQWYADELGKLWAERRRPDDGDRDTARSAGAAIAPPPASTSRPAPVRR